MIASSDRRALVALLDLLCEHEECVIDAHTFEGRLDRGDALSARVVLHSRRVFRRAQSLMRMLEGEHAA